MTPALPQPQGRDRVVIMGPTDCGKTELARALLKTIPNVIVIDPKHRFEWREPSIPGKPGRYSRIARDLRGLATHLRQIEETHSGQPVIYRPPAEHFLPKNIGAVDEVFRIALARGDTTVYIDEMSRVVQSASGWANRIPHWFAAVTTGRELGVGVWAATQRPANIPISTKSESEFRITFYLRMEDDRARAEELCGQVDWQALADEDYAFQWGTDRYTSAPMALNLHTNGALMATA